MAKEPGYFTFIKNDGTSTSTSVIAKYDTMTAPSISNISGVDWTRDNYNFVEWNTNSNGTGASCSPGDTIDWDTYGECYAIWEEKHEVTIYYKGSTIAGMDASGTKTLNTEGTWVEADISVEYDRPTAPTPVYQSKTVNPSTSSQTVSADSGYDGLSSVTVNAMPSGVEGTPVATKSIISASKNLSPVSSLAAMNLWGSDLNAASRMGATLKTLAKGTYTISWKYTLTALDSGTFQYGSYIRWYDGSNWHILASYSLTTASNPSIGDTFNVARTITIDDDAYGKDINVLAYCGQGGGSAWRASVDEYQIEVGSQQTAFEPYQVSNAMSVTPSVMNESGYINGSTIVGDPVTVFPSELVSGTLSITSNANGINVTNYASVDVNVSGGGDDGLRNFIANHGTVSSFEDSSIIQIGQGAFAYCSSLASVSVPACTSIGSGAFIYCSSLTTASFPVCSYIGSNAFQYCTNLTTVSASVCSYIGNYAFQYCSSLTTASASVCSYIGSYAFAFDSRLASISFPVCSYIGHYAFQYCSSLTTVDFPSCITVGNYAFSGCSGLTTVSFPVCSYIISGAFQKCSSLTTVDFPNCINIHSYAFESCRSLTTASFPVCKTIGGSAFQKCFHLTSLYLLGSSVATLSYSTAFSSTPIAGYTISTGGIYGRIFVPSSLYDSYKAATNWQYFSSRFVSV